MADNNLTPLSYEQVRAMEQAGTGFASPDQTPWPAQQAAARQQEQQAAQAAATQDRASKARQSWTPGKHTRAKGAK